MFNEDIVKVLLIEDEEYDVRRVQNTVKPFSERIKITDVVSNGKAALETVRKNKDNIDVIIAQCRSGGTLRRNANSMTLRPVSELPLSTRWRSSRSKASC